MLREHGIEIRPSWLPFTPWATPQDILEILDFVIANEMVGNVDPIQYTIRLLVPKGSLLLDRPEITPHLQDYDRDRLTYDWQAADPQLDRLHAELAEIVEADVAAEVDSVSTFRTLYRAVADARDLQPTPPTLATSSRARGSPRHGSAAPSPPTSSSPRWPAASRSLAGSTEPKTALRFAATA